MVVVESSIIPGLTDDVAELCLARISRSSFRIVSQVCRRWRSFIKSEHFAAVRKSTGTVEELMCLLVERDYGRGVYWEVFDNSGNKLGLIPPIPGPSKKGSGVVVLDGRKILFVGGYAANHNHVSSSADVYDFNPATNSWRKLASMNIPRYHFAFAQVDGLLYVIGGYDIDSFCSPSKTEVYNPVTNQWSLIDFPNPPGWRGFAFSFDSKLYAVGNRIDVYDPKTQTQEELNLDKLMSVCSSTVLRNKVYVFDWVMPGCLRVFDLEENSWSSVFGLLPRERVCGYTLGVWNNKIMIFPQVRGHDILMYDPDKVEGSKWRVCDEIKPSDPVLASVLINF